jgi:putative SOS response-associated peptidase YedK
MGEVQAMLQPFPAQLMRAHPVSPKVGNVKNDTPDLIEPLGPSGEAKRDLLS